MGYKLIEREVLKKKLRGELEYYLHHNTLSPAPFALCPSVHSIPFSLLATPSATVRRLGCAFFVMILHLLEDASKNGTVENYLTQIVELSSNLYTLT